MEMPQKLALLHSRDEWMLQSLIGSTSLLWIEVQTTVQEVHKQIQLLVLRITHTLSIGH